MALQAPKPNSGSLSCSLATSSSIKLSWSVSYTGSTAPSTFTIGKRNYGTSSYTTFTVTGTAGTRTGSSTYTMPFSTVISGLSSSQRYDFYVVTKAFSSYSPDSSSRSISASSCTTTAPSLLDRTASFSNTVVTTVVGVSQDISSHLTITGSSTDGAKTYSVTAGSAGICTVDNSGVVTAVASGNCYVNFTIGDGSTYRTASTGTPKQITISATPLAAVATQPTTPVSKTAGQSYNVSVAGTCRNACTYQWKKDGTNIAGATSASYSIATLTASDAGSYTAQITDTFTPSNGSDTTARTNVVTSNASVLTVASALTITTPNSGLSGTQNTTYSLQLSASGGSGTKTFTTSSTLPTGAILSTSGLISGLVTSYGNYAITVTVTDANGRAVDTSSFTIAITQANTVPAAPGSLTLSAAGLASDGRLKSTWTLPSDGGSAITSIEYQFALESNSAWSPITTLAADATQVEFQTPLQATKYIFRVRAVNAVGNGNWQTYVTGVASTGTLPVLLDAPTAVVVTSGNASLSVAFTAPTPANDRSAITQYQYSTDNGATWSAGGTTSPISITGLTNGTTYQIKVRAVNGAGEGTASSTFTGNSKPATTPSAPTGLSLTKGTNSISASFTAGNTGGLTVAYEYQIKETVGGTYGSWTTGGASSPFTISGLTNDRSYTVKIRATNSLGSSAETAGVALDITNAAGVTFVTQPTGRTVTTGETSFSLTVAVTARAGDAVTYQWQKGGSNIVGATSATYSVSGVSITSLLHAGTYRCVITTTANGTTATTNSNDAVISVIAAPTVATSSVADGTVGASYSVDLAVTNLTGVAPFTWTRSSGSLPAGLTLSSAGRISGTPTASVSAQAFSVTVTDANGITSAVKNLTLTVNSRLAVSTVTLSAGTKGSSYNQTLTSTGGTGSKTWTLDQDRLPNGLSIAANGVISGTVGNDAESSRFTVKVTDASGATATAVLSITVASGTPGAPTGLTIGTISSGRVTLTWTAPVDPGSSAITQYYITYGAGRGESEDDEDEGEDRGAVPVNASGLTLPYTLTGLKNGRTYTITVSARNSSATGPGSNSVNAAIGAEPGAPRSVSLSLEDGGLKIRWKKPESAGGFKVSSYDVECQASGGGSWITISSDRNNSEENISTVGRTPALTLGTTYTCHVRAVTSKGTSSWVASATSLKLSTVPMAITTASATIPEKGKVTVTWNRVTDPNYNGGLTLTSYLATLRKSGDENEDDHSHDSDHKSCTVNRTGVSFDSEVSYTCTITGTPTKGNFKVFLYAINALGQSVKKEITVTIQGASQTLTIPNFTKEFTKTINGTTTNAGDNAKNQVKVGDSDFVIGATLSSGLSVRYSSTTTDVCTVKESKKIRILKDGTCSITITQNGKKDDDDNEESEYEALPGTNGVTFTVNANAPGSPSITGVAIGNAQLIISYAAPTGTGGAPATYDIQYSTDNSTWSPLSPLSSNTLSKTISGLTNGTPYYLRVRSVNTGGNSNWVRAAGTYTPITVPDSPTNVSVTADGDTSSATTSFDRPVNNGGSVLTSFTVTAKNPDNTVKGTCNTGYVSGTTSYSCKISSLVNGVTYKFSVVAKNAAGSSAPTSDTNRQIPTVSQTITAGSIAATGWTMGGPNLQTSASSDSGLPIIYTSADTSICTISSTGSVHFENDGTCTIYFDQDGKDKDGNSTKYAAATRVTRTFAIAPELPTAPVITSVTNGPTGLTVNWNAPSRLGSGTITYNVTGAHGSGNATCSTSISRSCVLGTAGGAVTGREYTITVTATNAKGVGPASTSRLGTWAIVPNNPGSLTAVASATDGRAADISWNKSTDDGGSTILRYEITASAAGRTSKTCSVNYSAGANSYSCSVRDIRPGVTYTITAVAINSIGSSTGSTTTVVPGKSQTISPSGSTISKTYGNSDFDLTSTVSSGRTPIYTSSNVAVCTVNSAGRVHIVGVGSCNVTVSEPGATDADENEYKAATSAVHAITVSPAAPGKPIITMVAAGSELIDIDWSDPSFTGGVPIASASVSAVDLTASPNTTTTCVPTTPNTCRFDVNSSPAVINGHQYRLTVTVTNSAGSTSSDTRLATPYGVPAAPSELNVDPGVTPGGSHFIDLYWAAPTSNGGHTPDYYVVYYSTLTDTPIAQVDFASNSYTVTSVPGSASLTSGTSYTFKISVHYSDFGAESAMSGAETGTTFDVPTAPLSVTVAKGYSGGAPNLTVSWKEPASDNGDPINSYTATATAVGHTPKTCTATAPALTCTIADLDAATSYTVTVYATNYVGNSALGSAASAVTTISTPGAPVTPVATGNNATGEITVTWQKPVSDGGSAVLNYTVVAYQGASPTASKCVVAQSADADTNGYSCKFTGLAYKTAFNFKVTAANIAGAGATSAASNTVTLELNQTITFGSLSTLNFPVGFTTVSASSDSGLAVTLTSNSTGVCTIAGNLVTFVSVGTCSLTASQSGLLTNYNAATPVTQTFLIAAVAPDAITLLQATPGSGAITAKWSAAVQLGGSTLTGYVLSWAKNSDFSDQTSITLDANTTTRVISGLDAKQLYYVRVKVLVSDYSAGSAWSNVLDATTFGLPLAPTITAAVSSAPQTATITWGAISSADNGGTSITGYSAEAYIGDVATGKFCTTGTTSCTIAGLSGAVTYKFKATTYNAVGGSTGPFFGTTLQPGSSQTIAATNVTVEHAIKQFKLNASSSSGLGLIYAATDKTYLSAGGRIGARTVCTVDQDGIVTVDLAGTCEITLNQNGLDVGNGNTPTSYLAATQVTITVTVDPSDPGATTDLNISQADKHLDFTWTAPIDDGGVRITRYITTWYDVSTSPAVDHSALDDAAWLSSGTALNYKYGRISVLESALTKSGTTYTEDLTDLTNGVTYRLISQAVNEANKIGPQS